MQVFEFHFNPKAREDFIFDSFCYEPENIYERKAGSLYMVGALKNVLPQNFHFLDQLAQSIKEKYYTQTFRSLEKSFKASLKGANDSLEKIAKDGNVGWLGNLSFAILSLKPYLVFGQTKWEVNFTKVGGIKILLMRSGQMTDIGKNLEMEGIEPYPLKIFTNIVTGKLAENDLILILTKEVFDCFLEEKLLEKIAELSLKEEQLTQSQNFNAELKKIFNTKREQVLKISGVCLAVVLGKEVLASKKEAIISQPKRFSLKEAILRFAPKNFGPLIKKPRFLKLRFLRLPKLELLKTLKLPKIAIPKLSELPKGASLLKSKNIILVLTLILFLISGFFVFQKEKRQQLKDYQIILNEAQEKVDRAEGFLILKNTNPQITQKANLLLKEAWKEVLPLSKIERMMPASIANQVSLLKESIEKKLYQSNKLIEVPEPNLFFEFNSRGFIPQKMVFFRDNLYFFSPYSKNLFKVDKEGRGELIQTEKKINLAASLDDSLLFFSKKSEGFLILKAKKLSSASLKRPSSDFNFDDFCTYRSNLYFLNKKSGEIVKYPFQRNFEWGSPRLWLSPKTKKPVDAKSMAVDGSLWLLAKDNSICRYYAGRAENILKIDIFPEIKDLSKVLTFSSLPYLYILEPSQKRIIVLDKSGQIIQQFQSKKFDNLLDFAISKDGKTIYLLNNLKVYQIKF